jgi:hypothetical protein
MKKQILFGLLFLTLNILITQIHIWVFQSRIPFAVFVSIILHFVGLLYFPYSKIFKL